MPKKSKRSKSKGAPIIIKRWTGQSRLVKVSLFLLVFVAIGIVAIRSRAATPFQFKAVNVKLRSNYNLLLQQQSFAGPNTYDANSINSLVGEKGRYAHQIKQRVRLFKESAAQINSLRAQARQQSGDPGPDLNQWYQIKVSDDADPEAIAASLQTLPSVESAEAVVALPKAMTPDFVPLQTYRPVPAPGIGAGVAKSFIGATGNKVRLFDIELGWYFNHEDLASAKYSIIKNGTPVYNSQDHGAAILGESVATPNTYGVTGIVPQVRVNTVNVLNTERGSDIPGAVITAINNSSPGDVFEMPIGVCLGATDCNAGKYVAVEASNPVYDAIKLATAAGRIVVEAAGNSHVNLDTYHSATVVQFPYGKANSGAEIIGAGSSGTTCTYGWGLLARTPLPFTNYGKRVNMQNWGECVTTAGGLGNLTPSATVTRQYTDSFNGTSSASGMTGGMAAAVSSYYETLYGKPATPAYVHTALRSTAVAQVSAPELIGPQPHLDRALNYVKTHR